MFHISNELSAKEIFCTPETYGAIGDGIHDDSPAFNECIRRGKSIKLKKGKTYLLKSRIHPIQVSDFSINGKNSSIIISKDYPTDQYEQVFKFKEGIKQLSLNVYNLSMTCLLEDKFKGDHEALGDTYMFFVTDCDQVVIKNVNFNCDKLYNNVSFLVSWGTGYTEITGCNLVQNTMSKQGGLFWLMNRSKESCTVNISNSYFEYDDWDEVMCFSAAKKTGRSEIDVTVNNCTFASKCKCESSGFIIAYNQVNNAYADINISYNNCMFEAEGEHMRHIQTYQSGFSPNIDYGKFITHFNECSFRFDIKEKPAFGLLGLLPLEHNSVPKENIGYYFDNCDFVVKGNTPVISDKDGNSKGFFVFNNCNINSEGRALQKQYNAEASDIDLTINKSSVISSDEYLATARFSAKNSYFKNTNGKSIAFSKVTYGKSHPIKIENCSVNNKNIAIGNNETYPLYAYTRIDPTNKIVGDLCSGSILCGGPNDGRDCNIYYYSPKLKETVVCILNGKSFPMQYIEKEKTYYTNLKFSNNAYKIGSNRIQVFDKIIDFTISD